MLKLGTLAMVVLLSVILHFEGVRPNAVQVQERANSRCKPGDYRVDGCKTQVCAKVGKKRFWVYGYDANTCCDYGDQYFPLGQTIVVPSTNGQNITLLCQDLGAGPSIQATCDNSLVDAKLNCLLEKIAPNHCADTTTASTATSSTTTSSTSTTATSSTTTSSTSTTISTSISTTISTDWQQYPGPGDPPGLVSIVAGLFGVWGIRSDDSIWRKTTSGWTVGGVGGALADISVGRDSIWGVDSGGRVYKWTDSTEWHRLPGALKQVSVSGVDDDIVWGVKSDNSVVRWTGSSWVTVDGTMSMVSCGQTGVWALLSGEIYYRTGTYGGVNSAGTGWEPVWGGYQRISTGMAGEVWGVGGADNIYKRDGITASNPTGTQWTHVEGPAGGKAMKQVAVFGGKVWGLVTGPGPDYDIWYRAA